jgi:hypothetical protein
MVVAHFGFTVGFAATPATNSSGLCQSCGCSRLFQLTSGVEVEVICGFVQQQHMRTAQQHEAQRRARLLAAAEGRELLRREAAAQAEAAQEVAGLLVSQGRRDGCDVVLWRGARWTSVEGRLERQRNPTRDAGSVRRMDAA